MAAGNWVPELVEIAGGVDVLGVRGEHSAWLEWAALEKSEPEAIVLMPCGFDMPRSRQELPALTGRAEWARLEAVQRGRVFVTDGTSSLTARGRGWSNPPKFWRKFSTLRSSPSAMRAQAGSVSTRARPDIRRSNRINHEQG